MNCFKEKLSDFCDSIEGIWVWKYRKERLYIFKRIILLFFLDTAFQKNFFELVLSWHRSLVVFLFLLLSDYLDIYKVIIMVC